jgi:hypothetical protein
MIAGISVKERKEGMVRKPLQHFVNERQQELILLSSLLKFSVVSAHQPPNDGSLRDEFILLILNDRHAFFLWHDLNWANPLTIGHMIDNPSC